MPKWEATLCSITTWAIMFAASYFRLCCLQHHSLGYTACNVTIWDILFAYVPQTGLNELAEHS